MKQKLLENQHRTAVTKAVISHAGVASNVSVNVTIPPGNPWSVDQTLPGGRALTRVGHLTLKSN